MEKRTLYYGRYAFPDLSGVVSYVMLCYAVFYLSVVTYVLRLWEELWLPYEEI